MQEKALTLSAWIDSASSITIVSHARPDGDAAGSCAAAAAYLRECRGKDAAIVLPDALPESLAFVMDGQDCIIASESRSAVLERLAATDLLFCLDFNTMSRAEGIGEELAACSARKVLVDHHEAPAIQEFDLCFSSTQLSSACELLYNLLMEMPDIQHDAAKLPHSAACALMTGMTTDTNNFANSVFPGTLRMASELLAAGVDRDAIIDRIYFSERPNRLAAQGEFLSSHLNILPCGAAIAVLTSDFFERHALKEGETEGFVNMPLAVKEVRLSILAREEPGRFRVSLRSKRGVSARSLASSQFHGGGHEQASGGKILIPEDIACPSAAKEYLERVAARFMQENNTVD